MVGAGLVIQFMYHLVGFISNGRNEIKFKAPTPMKSTKPSSREAQTPNIKEPPCGSRSLNIGISLELGCWSLELFPTPLMKKIFQKWFPPFLMLVIAALIFFWQSADAQGQGFRVQRIRPPAAHRQRAHPAAGFPRPQCPAATARETDAQCRAVEGMESTAEDHPCHRMAGQRDDESRRGR